MSNPNRLGELSKLYYILADTDITGLDATVLALGWIEFCVKSVGWNRNINEIEFNDRCEPNNKTYAPGKRAVQLDLELNEIRLDITTVRAWQTAIDNGDVIAILGLNSDNADDEAFGFVGNFVFTTENKNEPEEGPNMFNYSLRPAARSAFTPVIRRIYGATVT